MRTSLAVAAAVAGAALLWLTGATTAEGGSAAPPRVVRMTDGLQFLPSKVTIKVGQTVAWKNVGKIGHTITTIRSKAAVKSHAAVPPGAPAWDSGFILGSRSYSRSFTKPGVYRYFCIPHEGGGMVGTIVVR